MTFTQSSDIYVALQDAGINRLINHIMMQRPAFVNYGSILPVTDPRPVCKEIRTVPQVVQAKHPLITSMNRLPVFQTPLALDYIVQVTKGAVDFFPGRTISLPPELNPPLKEQQFALNLEVCAGLVCPSSAFIPRSGRRAIDCFCLNLFATGGFGIEGLPGKQAILANISGIEIPEIKPDGMVEAVECYALVALNQGILPKFMDIVSTFVFNLIKIPPDIGDIGNIMISSPIAVPHNPAIEDNQLKAFINIDKLTLYLPLSPSGPSSGNASTGTVTRTSRLRNRTGVFDLTGAVSAGAFEKIYTSVVKGFRFSKSGKDSYGPFSVDYDVAAHLEGGSLEMRDDGTIVIKELDIKWDKLILSIGIDIPKKCIGGNKVCAVPLFPTCGSLCFKCVTLPSICFFDASPDFSIPIDLSRSITSEVSFSARLESFYGVGSGIPNRWQMVVVPTLPLDIDVIDIADTVGDLFKNRVQGEIDNLLNSAGAPDWAIDLINEYLGGIDHTIREILDIPDDIGEWLIDMITRIGIFDSLLNALYDYITVKIPAVLEIDDPFEVRIPEVLEIDDPFEVRKEDGVIIPVKIPIEFIGVSVNSREIVIEGDVGN